MSIRTHSQTSNIFVTFYGFLGNRLRTGGCNAYESCFKSHALKACLDFAFIAVASLFNIENAGGWRGSNTPH